MSEQGNSGGNGISPAIVVAIIGLFSAIVVAMISREPQQIPKAFIQLTADAIVHDELTQLAQVATETATLISPSPTIMLTHTLVPTLITPTEMSDILNPEVIEADERLTVTRASNGKWFMVGFVHVRGRSGSGWISIDELEECSN